MPARLNTGFGDLVVEERDPTIVQEVQEQRADVGEPGSELDRGHQVLRVLEDADRYLRAWSAPPPDRAGRHRLVLYLLDVAQRLARLRGPDGLEKLIHDNLGDHLTDDRLRGVLADVIASTTGPKLVGSVHAAYLAQVEEEHAGRRHSPADTANAWAPPVPLRTFTPPRFPTACLPPGLREYVEALARATQTPADLPALATLAVAATACAKRAEVEVRPDWVEPLNIFTAVVLPPGNLKSAVFVDVTRPLSEFQGAEAARLSLEIKRSQARRKVAEKVLERAQAEAAKANDPKERTLALAEVDRATAELNALPIMVSPRLWVDDVTPEKLAILMAEQGERLALLSAEGGVFGLMAGRYVSNGGPNIDVFLKGHAGDRLAVDRVGREPVVIEAPALTVGLAVQPDVIRSLANTPEFRGRGLLARFLYAVPQSLVGARDLDAPHVPDEVRAGYEAIVKTLLSIEATQNARRLRLTNGAANRLREFRAWLEPQLGLAGELSVIADWGSKLSGAVARIAALLHMAGQAHARAPWELPISSDTMAAAVAIGRHLIPHAEAAFGLMGADPALEDAERVLAWLRRGQVERLSIRDAMRTCRSLRTGEQAQAAVKVLLDRGWLRPEERPEKSGPGRPAGETWSVSPFARSAEPGTLGQKGQKGQNPCEPEAPSSFVLSVTCPAGDEPPEQPSQIPEPRTEEVVA